MGLPTFMPRFTKIIGDRVLSLVTAVHPGEGVTAALLSANVFILLASYYVLKTVRESLILSQGGAEIKSYSAAGQALLLLLVVPAYGMLSARVSRIGLITWVNLFFTANLFIFFLLGTLGFRVAIPFFLWVGIFNVLIIAQFWAFANDVYVPEQGQRLFPLVGIGSSLGAWFGSSLAGRIFDRFSPYELMLMASAGLLAATVLAFLVHRRMEKGPHPERQTVTLSKTGGFQLVLSDRYLMLIAILIVMLNVVNTTGEFILGKLVVNAASSNAAQQESQVFIGQFYGSFYSWVNFCGLMFQVFLVSRIFKYIGVGGALFILPSIAFLCYGIVATIPVLAIVRTAKILENSTDYSIQNTARHALFLPTSRDAKYKAKAAIDTFFWRAGDVLQAVVVFVGVQLAFGIRSYARLNAIIVLLWLIVAIAIFREHKRKMAELDRDGLP